LQTKQTGSSTGTSASSSLQANCADNASAEHEAQMTQHQERSHPKEGLIVLYQQNQLQPDQTMLSPQLGQELAQ